MAQLFYILFTFLGVAKMIHSLNALIQLITRTDLQCSSIYRFQMNFVALIDKCIHITHSTWHVSNMFDWNISVIFLRRSFCIGIVQPCRILSWKENAELFTRVCWTHYSTAYTSLSFFILFIFFFWFSFDWSSVERKCFWSHNLLLSSIVWHFGAISIST